MDKRFKKIVFIITVYFVYIKLFNGYYPYFPSIPIYPNNSQDLAKTKLAMANRSPQDVQFFLKTNDSVVPAFAQFIPHFDVNILHNVANSHNNLILFFKYFINRRRPYQIDYQLQPISTKTSNTPAFPAGHAYQAQLLSLFLSDKFPTHAKLWQYIAIKCDHTRVKAGIHYFSDGIASRRILQYTKFMF